MGILDRMFNNHDDEDVEKTIPVETVQSIKRIDGKIIKLSPQKGFGFISSLEIPFTRIFFHWSALKPTTLHFTDLEVGMKVSFKPVEVPNKGWRAIQIEVIEKTSFINKGTE